MMFYHNSSNQLNDGLVRHLNGWSQVVPISMPWAANTVTSTTTTATPISNPHMMATAEGVNYQPNVMHFTANTSETPINPSLLPYNLQPTVDTLPPKDCPFDVLCPDPCTSQTATRWELLHNMTTNESAAGSVVVEFSALLSSLLLMLLLPEAAGQFVI
ncbi:unnamed protein product [Oppiella nova]|uniref:Uncharacterized protein n=1 Tax=Oppiella nova TaxID=334625 RepID=A0A7R9LC38_9ACAR|nr:unnamed protein product [Oppiella nova]CAG2162084.1 unnamed protein product [Oppiella nova]